MFFKQLTSSFWHKELCEAAILKWASQELFSRQNSMERASWTVREGGQRFLPFLFHKSCDVLRCFDKLQKMCDGSQTHMKQRQLNQTVKREEKVRITTSGEVRCVENYLFPSSVSLFSSEFLNLSKRRRAFPWLNFRHCEEFKLKP